MHNSVNSKLTVVGAEKNFLSFIKLFFQYYIYAENDNIGAFSPAKAAYEFYTIESNFTTITAGDLVINEIMASNTKTATDQDGEYDDWTKWMNVLKR